MGQLVGGEQGAALLNKFKLLDGGIDHACETGDFSHAFALAERGGAKRKIPDVELKYAMFLEDEGRFADAEVHFVRADKPKEAIDMWTHQRDWAAAMRVAEKHAPQSVGDVLAARAASHAEANEAGESRGYLRQGQTTGGGGGHVPPGAHVGRRASRRV